MKKPVSVFTDNLRNVSTAAYDVSSDAYPACLSGRTFFVLNYEVLDVRKLFPCISMCACVYECYGYQTLCSNVTAFLSLMQDIMTECYFYLRKVSMDGKGCNSTFSWRCARTFLWDCSKYTKRLLVQIMAFLQSDFGLILQYFLDSCYICCITYIMCFLLNKYD